ncbi:MAG: VPGUxxT family thioredoxin-like (seleno)protein, type 2 [Bacteroidota bacterium]
MNGNVTLIMLLIFTLLTPSMNAQTDLSHQSEELGNVNWYRDYDAAVAKAKKEQKDILILFQEVPGCATCRNYGKNVLSNPLLVEAIENLFIPLAIFNNKKGKDLEILKKYNEPSWNNPVVRIINYNGRNVINRISGNYSMKALHQGMEKALNSYGKSAPGYFKLLGEQIASNGKDKEKYFKMYCFWSGEKQLAKIDGVLETESGFMNHAEVVKIKYNPEVVDSKTIEKYAAEYRIQPVIFDTSYRTADNDVHYYLRHTDYKYIPLSPLQQTKINSALGSGKSGKEYLSPKQTKWLMSSMASKSKRQNLLNMDFKKAWNLAENSNLTEDRSSK